MPFLLTTDGFPYALGTASLAALPTDAGGEITPDLTLVRDALDWGASRLAWTERMEPLDGDLRCDQLAFVLHDVPVSAGPAAGHNLLTWMATRAPALLTSTTLAGGASGAGTNLLDADLAFTVADGGAFPSGSQHVYVEGEALLIDARSGNTFTVNAAGRGAFMSRAVTHYLDVNAGLYPEVWADCPFITRRRVIFWYVDPTTNVATPLWRGKTLRAPRLAAGGARFEWQAEPLWQVERAATFVDSNATCRFRGYNAKGFNFAVTLALGTDGNSAAPLPADTAVYDFWTDMFDRSVKPTFEAAVAAAAHWTPTYDQATDLGDQIEWRASGTGGALAGVVQVGAQTSAHTYTAQSQDGVDPRSFTLRFPKPAAMVVGSPFVRFHLPVDRISGLPATWTTLSFADPGGLTTRINPMLAGQYNAAITVYVREIAQVLAHDTHFANAPGPSVVGALAQYAPTLAPANTTLSYGLQGGFPTPGAAGSALTAVYVDTDLLLRYTINVETDHWLYGVQHALADTTLLRTGSDPRNWDFSNAADVVGVTDSAVSARDFYFDGRQQVGALLAGLCALTSCAVGIRGSKLAVVPFRRATGTEDPVATITRADLVPRELQTWETLPDGIANVCQVTSDAIALAVREARSIGRYGEARTVKIDLTGFSSPSVVLDNYAAFTDLVLSRVLYLWNNPLALARVPLPLSWAARAWHGDFVAIAEDVLPDGAGGRGLGGAAALAALGVNAQLGMVIGRSVDVSGGVCWYELLLFPAASGYSPCVRLATLSGDTATAATAYVDGAGDYTDAVSLADGGARYLRAGDRVRLLMRDVVTDIHEDLVVLSVTGGTIKFTSTPSAHWATDLAGGAWIDLVYSPRSTSGLQAGQVNYAWVGSRAAGVIGGTSQRDQEWSP